MITLLRIPTVAELDLDDLADKIASHGAASLRDELHAVASVARESGASQRLAAIVTDDTAPEIVRARAFGRLAATLSARLAASAAPPADAQRLCA